MRFAHWKQVMLHVWGSASVCKLNWESSTSWNVSAVVKPYQGNGASWSKIGCYNLQYHRPHQDSEEVTAMDRVGENRFPGRISLGTIICHWYNFPAEKCHQPPYADWPKNIGHNRARINVVTTHLYNVLKRPVDAVRSVRLLTPFHTSERPVDCYLPVRLLTSKRRVGVIRSVNNRARFNVVTTDLYNDRSVHLILSVWLGCWPCVIVRSVQSIVIVQVGCLPLCHLEICFIISK